MTPSRLCCCVTCGLPASGKTSLCKLIQELAAVQTSLRRKTIIVVHIAFDDIISEIEHVSDSANQDHSLWKDYRRAILESLDYVFKELLESDVTLSRLTEQLLQHGGRTRSEMCDADTAQMWDNVWSRVIACLSEAAAVVGGTTGQDEGAQQILFLIDDNMFYRSMRYEYFQLSRKYSSGFCQIGLECSLETAMERNSQRIHGIPKETMLKMADKLELPDASKALWERNSILIDAHDPVDHAILAPVWMLIQSAFDSPLSPIQEEDTEAKDQSRAECASSVLHQADQTLRKCISDLMAEAKGKQSKEDMKDLASQLGISKTHILEDLRKGDIIPPSLESPREEFEAFFRNCLSNKLER